MPKDKKKAQNFAQKAMKQFKGGDGVSSKDLPGSGMAKQAGESMEKRQNKRKEVMSELFGTDKK